MFSKAVIWDVWAGQTAGRKGGGLPVTGLAGWTEFERYRFGVRNF